MSDASQVVLSAAGVSRHYEQGEGRIDVLQELSLTVRTGEMVAVIGRSGSGKSSLLHVLGGLDEPNSGTVHIKGEQMNGVGNDAQAALRNRYMGFVYQMHHLLPEFSALENVAMPLRLGGLPRAAAHSQASEMLARVGLAEREAHRPHMMSGGERQRAAVARALIAQPELVLADEPTGNLDKENADAVMALLLELARERGMAFVVVTHDDGFLDQFDRVLRLTQGKLEDG